jgi:CubicO group peptidase (beta-lactamase class C family)
MAMRVVRGSLLVLLCACHGGGGMPAVDAGGGDAGGGADAGAPDASVEDGGPPTDEAAFAALMQAAEMQMRDEAIPGLGIAIVEHGVVTRAVGLGTTLRDGEVPVTATTRFSAGSISKTFLAAAAMSLVEEGLLDLDAPITRYVPFFGVAQEGWVEGLTARRLLSHTGGYPGWLEESREAGIPSWTPEGLTELYQRNDDVPLWYEPGALFVYSNTGYSVASLLVERAGGSPWHELVQARVVDPLGLATATFQPDGPPSDYAVGHVPEPGGGEAFVDYGDWGYSSTHGAAGGLWIGAEDLGRFAAFLASGDGAGVLEAETLAAMSTAQPATRDGYGLGTSPFDYRGVAVVGHGGAIAGFTAEVMAVPEEGFGVAVLCNLDSCASWRLALRAIDLFVGPDGPPPMAAAPPPLDELAGNYTDTAAMLGRLRVERAGDGLEVAFLDEGEARRALVPVNGPDFFIEDLPAIPGFDVPVSFWPDGSGRWAVLASRLGVAHRTD